MIQYPVAFHATAYSRAGIATPWDIESQGLGTQCAIPPEFEGPGGAFSPEDLFAQAITNCFVATFKVYVEKSKLVFETMTVHTELIVDLNEQKKPVMKKCLLKVVISGCANPERVRMLAQKAVASGFILNSVKTELEFDLDVT